MVHIRHCRHRSRIPKTAQLKARVVNIHQAGYLNAKSSEEPRSGHPVRPVDIIRFNLKNAGWTVSGVSLLPSKFSLDHGLPELTR